MISIITILQGPDPYGQVKDGYLIIKGPFIRAMVGNKSPHWPYQPNFVPIDVLILGLAEDDEQVKYGHVICDIEWPTVGTNVSLLKRSQRRMGWY